MLQRVKFLLTVLLSTVLLVGCGGTDTPVEQAEEEAGVEEIAQEEETTAPVNPQEEWMNASEEEKAEIKARNVAERERQIREEAEAVIQNYESGAPVEKVYCQLAKAQLDLGEEEAQKLLDEYELMGDGPSVQELQEQGMDAKEAMDEVRGRMNTQTLPEYLAEKGYDCDDPPSPQERGTNEAGQDVSNTPEVSQRENAERLPCFQAYLQSFGEEAGREQQRVVAEANRQGVTPYDIAGC